jgi:predicted amidohydrolase YtcJ
LNVHQVVSSSKNLRSRGEHSLDQASPTGGSHGQDSRGRDTLFLQATSLAKLPVAKKSPEKPRKAQKSAEKGATATATFFSFITVGLKRCHDASAGGVRINPLAAGLEVSHP